jgi:quercetin dioxygenase-like cupin family protein
MPIIMRSKDLDFTGVNGSSVSPLLNSQIIGNDQIELDFIIVPNGSSYVIRLAETSVGWLQILSGTGSIGKNAITKDNIVYFSLGLADDFQANEGDCTLLIARIPHAKRFDPDIEAMPEGLTSVDWTREPVLQSEHDARKRVYMATPALAGTIAFKGEMITYPPGSAAPEHHHVGAEHFQYVLSGQGTAILDGKPTRLDEGDLLYNYQNEPHAFINETSDEFIFVEFFVPGPCETVWSPGANLCAWLPTGVDTEGRKPSRNIGYHVHGEDDGI